MQTNRLLENLGDAAKIGRLAVEDFVLRLRVPVLCDVENAARKDDRGRENYARTQQVADDVLDALIGPPLSLASH